jgi:hypothetical protein
MVDYIFYTLKKQAKFNRTAIIFALALASYSVLQHKKIKKLENELKEIKKQRGE